MQEAKAETVLGDFDDARFEDRGNSARFFRRDGRFFVHTEDADGKLRDFPIRYVIGVDPLQQYLVEFPGGRLQTLTIAWDTRKQRWFSLYPDQKIALDDPLHWTGRYQNWNLMCAECHTTGFRKGYDPGADAYRSTWSQFHVGCQACHGPGAKHVGWARGLGTRNGDESLGLTVRFKELRPDERVDACGQCHSRRSTLKYPSRPGEPYLDRLLPALLHEGLYHPDGQQLDEVYEYGSFLQSRMYQRGVRCTDCHDPHTLGLPAAGNAVCTRCHQERPGSRFPGLNAKTYDSPSHHFHTPGSAGAQCVNCHMPAKNYMIVDVRRDHGFRVPRPDLSVKLGAPNACNGCHSDKSARWAADTVKKRSGSGQSSPHFAESFAAARRGDPAAVPALRAIAEDRAQPPIVRATALELLSGFPLDDGSLEILTADPEPLVRLALARAGESQPSAGRIPSLPSLLKDPVRAVRTQAARSLALSSSAQIPAEQRTLFERVLAEYRESETAMADMPSTHLNLAMLETALGRFDWAERSYRTALRMDPYFLPATHNLARFYKERQRNRDAERVLREGILRHPREGELYYPLGLLLAEERRLGEAVEALGKAAGLLPESARVHYNYALALQQSGQLHLAEKELLKAHGLGPGDTNTVYALAVFYAQQGQWRKALNFGEKLLHLLPHEAGVADFVADIRRQLSIGEKRR